MDQGQVLLVNLAKGRIGEDSSSLLGALLVTTIGLAAYSRADMTPAERRDFFVYIDQFQRFTTFALANMLSELRKYRVGFTVAHQYLHQLNPDVRHAVLGNAASVISFTEPATSQPGAARQPIRVPWYARGVGRRGHADSDAVLRPGHSAPFPLVLRSTVGSTRVAR
jgi:hypothetical protein